MRRDHAPIVDVQLRVTADFRDDDLRARYVKAHAAQAERNADREWRERVKAKHEKRAAAPSNVLLFGGAAKQ